MTRVFGRLPAQRACFNRVVPSVKHSAITFTSLVVVPMRASAAQAIWEMSVNNQLPGTGRMGVDEQAALFSVKVGVRS